MSNVIPFTTSRRAASGDSLTTSASVVPLHRRPPVHARETLSRPRPGLTVGDWVVHKGQRFSGRMGHIVDAHISPATRSITRFIVSFGGIHASIRPDELKPASRAHHIVASTKAGA